jgi:hypothetical protein
VNNKYIVKINTVMSNGSLSLYGVTIPQRGASITSFSVPFIVLNMIGSGLSWFVAMSWSNVFQSALDEYKHREESTGNKFNQVWMNFVLAIVATIFTIAIIYLMIRSYTAWSSLPPKNISTILPSSQPPS